MTEQLDEKEIIATLVRIAEEESVFGIEVAIRPEQANGTSAGAPDRKYAILMARAAAVVEPAGAEPAPTAEVPDEPATPPTEPAPAAIVRAPLVGIFHRGLEPGGRPLVEVGAKVRAGQMLCCVECLKVFREVSSETAGIVLEVLAEDEEPVDYGRPLFRVQPLPDEE